MSFEDICLDLDCQKAVNQVKRQEKEFEEVCRAAVEQAKGDLALGPFICLVFPKED